MSNNPVPLEARSFEHTLPYWQGVGERSFSTVSASSSWTSFSLNKFLQCVRAAADGREGEPTVHFFASEKPVRDVETIRRSIARESWSSLDQLDEVLTDCGFKGTIRVTQLHRLDNDIENVVANCLDMLDGVDRASTGRQAPADRRAILDRFFHHHGGVNAYYSMKGSDRAIPFHRDPGDVFAFQAAGAKLWELGSTSTLYGGSYHDTKEGGCVQVTLTENQLLFLPRGIRHRAQATPNAISLHYVLMVDSAPEYWVLSGLAEALKDMAFFNGNSAAV